MKSFVRLVLGLLLIYAGFSRQEIFYRIRGIQLRKTGVIFMRVIYIATGIFLIIL